MAISGFQEIPPIYIFLLILYCLYVYFLLLPTDGKWRNMPVFQGDSSVVGALANPPGGIFSLAIPSGSWYSHCKALRPIRVPAFQVTAGIIPPEFIN